MNCYVLLNSKWFQGTVIHTYEDVAELFEEYPEWDRSLFTLKLEDHEFLCFLDMRPWDLFVIEDDYLIFL